MSKVQNELKHLKLGSIARIVHVGNSYKAVTGDGVNVSGLIGTRRRKSTFDSNCALELYEADNGNRYWMDVPLSKIDIPEAAKSVDIPEDQKEMMEFIHSSYSLKPESLVMNELKWKYLIRSAVRGKNIMMTGMSGCGKTMSAKALVNALDRPDFYFNMGATQDPRATLIGNVQFNPESGTYMAESLFVTAIQTPNAVILLDELTRAHPDA